MSQPTEHQDPADRILSMVDPTPPTSEVEISKRNHDRASDVAHAVWSAARKEGLDIEAAKERARAAFTEELEKLLTVEAVVHAPTEPPPPPPEPMAVVTTPTTFAEAEALAEEMGGRLPTAAEFEAIAAGEMDAEGRDRSAGDVADLRAAGFEMAEPIYARGSRVNEEGVANAAKSRRQWEAMAPMADVLRDHYATIAGEDRRGHSVALNGEWLGLTDGGRLVVHPGEPEPILYDITPHAFSQVVSRIGCGGAAYLLACPPELRATNVNTWLDPETKARGYGSEVLLRTRRAERAEASDDEVFAVVSPRYATFDSDQVAAALSLAMPPEARGRSRYDRERAGFDAWFHTTVAPENFVAGEVFRVGIQVTTSDVGGGAIVVRAVALQNLCLNLIILDRAALPIASIRHVGSVEKLAEAFRAAVAKASKAIEPFMARWNSACADDLALGYGSPGDAENQVRGTFAALLDTKRVTLPGYRIAEAIDVLVAKWRLDESSATRQHEGATRAAIVNAITRAAHELEFPDAFAGDTMEQQASALLWPRRGSSRTESLPWMEPERAINRERTAGES